MGDWPIRAELAYLEAFVGQGDSHEEPTLSRVLVPVIGVVAPSVADQDHLLTNRSWVRWSLFVDGCL
jgi:hypothetical protein